MNAITNFTTRVVERYLPDAFILAIFLTVAVFLAAVGLTDSSPLDVVGYWGDGFSNLFTFAMQMTLVLLTGFVLALSPIVNKLLDKLTDIPKTPTQGYVLTAAISFVACYLNWGLGLVVGALVARAMGRKIKGIHFPLVVAAAYSAELVRGPSSSIPSVMATDGHFMIDETGIIPVSETLYSWWNIAITLAIFAALLLFYALVKVPQDQIIGFTGDDAGEHVQESKPRSEMSPAEKLDNSRILIILLGLLPATYLVYTFVTEGFAINLNTVILIFLTLALFAHRSVMDLLNAVEEAVTSTRGIILQFPLYAGVAGIMGESGLVQVFSDFFINIATEQTFPALTFLSAGIVNFFIPSGGGQWAVQGPVMMEAAAGIGADIPQTLMAFAWGDGWTNQVQPFWALPLLGVAGLSARNIMGYCVIWLVISGLIIGAGFTLVSFL